MQIHCSYDKLVDIKKLIPNPANPNTHPEAQIDKLALLIKNHGWRHPVTVSNRSGLLVAGHCRLLAAKKLGLSKVPVDYQDFTNEAEELAVLVSDNVVQELADVNGLKMADIIVELDQVDYDLELTALSKEQIEDYVVGPTGLLIKESNVSQSDIDKASESVEDVKGRNLESIKVLCPQCGNEFTVSNI
jgi:hypothetical protein